MTPLERLRLSVAVGHAVYGAELRLTTDRGDVITVSSHSAAQLDHCSLRRLVAASTCPGRPDVSDHIVAIELTGSLSDAGGGVYRVVRQGHEQRWIPSLLHPNRLGELLTALQIDGVDNDELHATLKPDELLGVTIIVLTTAERFVDRLDEAAEYWAASIAVDELSYAVSRDIVLAEIAARNGIDQAH